jgi:hypothetical protein
LCVAHAAGAVRSEWEIIITHKKHCRIKPPLRIRVGPNYCVSTQTNQQMLGGKALSRQQGRRAARGAGFLTAAVPLKTSLRCSALDAATAFFRDGPTCRSGAAGASTLNDSLRREPVALEHAASPTHADAPAPASPFSSLFLSIFLLTPRWAIVPPASPKMRRDLQPCRPLGSSPPH